PSIGKNIGLGYLPYEYCQEGRELLMEYLGEQFPMKVEAVGYKALYDPENKLPRS
ncbi:MAG: aminomethyl transferase family protein, partial [Gammaproteobacteria bacterium]